MKMSYEEGAFDVVVGNSILHHVPVEPAMAEIFRVVRPGGKVICFEPNSLNPQHAIDFGFEWRRRAKKLQFTDEEHPFQRWSLRRTIASVGFEAVAVEPVDFLHPLVPAPFVSLVDRLGRAAEKIPLVREISGSLLISGVKPADRVQPAEDEERAGTVCQPVSMAT
jgi:SAM-dependent methyltransferase